MIRSTAATLAAVAAVAAGFHSLIQKSDDAPLPVSRHAGCVAFQAENQRLCPDGLVYTIDHGDWIDSGHPTPIPPLPSR